MAVFDNHKISWATRLLVVYCSAMSRCLVYIVQEGLPHILSPVSRKKKGRDTPFSLTGKTEVAHSS